MRNDQQPKPSDLTIHNRKQRRRRLLRFYACVTLACCSIAGLAAWTVSSTAPTVSVSQGVTSAE